MLDIFGRKKILALQAELEKAQSEAVARGGVVKGLENYVNSLPHDVRKNYTAQVAGLQFVIKPQLQSMIMEQQAVLSRIGLSESESNFYRSNINCLHLLLDWFRMMSSEHQSDVEEVRSRVDEDATLVSSVRDQYNLNP